MTYEYKIVYHTDIDESSMNTLGSDGWQLVAYATDSHSFIFMKASA